MQQPATKEINNIAILGANFDTGNLGVSALAWSTIFLIKQQWPNANICFLGGLRYKTDSIDIAGLPVNIETYPVRYCKNIFIKNHIWKLLAGIVFKQIYNKPFHKRKGNTLDALLHADLICDITGGDSFSDIYGMSRLTKGYLLKRLCQIAGTSFIMLPQTYGPFKSSLSKLMAKRILKKTQKVYSRDKEGIQIIEKLIRKSGKIVLCPDVAFILDAKYPKTRHHLPLSLKSPLETENEQLKTTLPELIGINVSGLLYGGGYTGNNQFDLRDDYSKLMREIIDYFTTLKNTNILLVPHVVTAEWHTENDLLACRKLRDSLPERIKQRVIIAEPDQGLLFFDQCEIKYLIGRCDFFMGSRMHATIASVSQCIPTVGLAYSKKFTGVYETAGMEKCVADLRILSNKDVMRAIKNTYNNKVLIKNQLLEKIPEVKRQVCSIFEGM